MSAKPATKKASTAKKAVATPAKKASSKKVVDAPVKEDPETPEAGTEKKERKRRDVNKETIDADFSAFTARIEAEIARLRGSTEKVRGIKFLRSLNKAHKTLHSDTKRVMKLKKKNNRKKTVVSGFLKPIKISKELADFTGWDGNGTYSRVTVTKFICDYIKTNGLFDETDKRLIMCDERLKNLLKYDPENPGLDKKGKPALLNYFRLQRYLKGHFLRIETPKEANSGEEKEEKTSAPKKAAPAAKKAASGSGKKAPAKKAVVVEEEEEDLEEAEE